MDDLERDSLLAMIRRLQPCVPIGMDATEEEEEAYFAAERLLARYDNPAATPSDATQRRG